MWCTAYCKDTPNSPPWVCKVGNLQDCVSAIRKLPPGKSSAFVVEWGCLDMIRLYEIDFTTVKSPSS